MNFPSLLRFVGLFFCVLAFPGAAGAREIHLKKGEVYHDRDLTVTCEERQAGGSIQALAVRECQYWDDFDKKCLFERITHSYNNVECVEECQHWDSFSNTCNYQTKCTFYPRQEAFVLRTCAEFDDYSRKCLKFREEKIGAGQ